MPTIVVAILNQKGGVGKTTLTVNIARALARKGNHVLVVDSDLQGSARDWSAAGGENHLAVVGIDRPTLEKSIKAIQNGYHWILIDGAPGCNKMVISAIKCADIVLIPVTPSALDVWATSDLVDLIKTRQSITEGKPKTAFVITKRIRNTRIDRDLREALTSYDLPIFEASTISRVSYVDSIAIGETVFDLPQKEKDAKEEILAITNELENFIYENDSGSPECKEEREDNTAVNG